MGLKKSEIELEKDKIVNKNDEFLEQNFEMARRIEQKAAETTTENKQNEFPKEYYKMHYLPQTVTKIETDKKEETETYLKTDFEYFSKEIISINKSKLEKRKNKLVH